MTTIRLESVSGPMPRIRPLSLALTVLLLSAPGAAVLSAASPDQEDRHQHHSAYAGEPDSGVAGLTAMEIEQLEAGAGMGMARPAELNGYPGPKHVLELAEELELSPEQRRAVEASHQRMAAEARRIGDSIIERERHLARRFEHHHIDEGSLREIVSEIAALYGELRLVHLRAHLETTTVLDPEQIAAYDRLRGYAPEESIRQ